MTKYQKALLAGVAALAIAAGTGLASAQSPGGSGMEKSGAAASQSPATQATPSKSQGQRGAMSQREGAGMQRNGAGSGMQAQKQPGSTGEKGKSSAQQAQGPASGSSRSAEKPQTRSGQGSTAQNGQNGQNGMTRSERQKGSTARSEQMKRPSQGTAERERTNRGTAQRERVPRGLQGNASEPMQGAERSNGASGNVKFSDKQRTTIKRTIIDARGAPRADHVKFDVRVGTVVPRGSIHVTTVPETLVRIEPRWRGFLYFVYEDEIVVVDPHDMHIVAVVAV